MKTKYLLLLAILFFLILSFQSHAQLTINQINRDKNIYNLSDKPIFLFSDNGNDNLDSRENKRTRDRVGVTGLKKKEINMLRVKLLFNKETNVWGFGENIKYLLSNFIKNDSGNNKVKKDLSKLLKPCSLFCYEQRCDCLNSIGNDLRKTVNCKFKYNECMSKCFNSGYSSLKNFPIIITKGNPYSEIIKGINFLEGICLIFVDLEKNSISKHNIPDSVIVNFIKIKGGILGFVSVFHKKYEKQRSSIFPNSLTVVECLSNFELATKVGITDIPDFYPVSTNKIDVWFDENNNSIKEPNEINNGLTSINNFPLKWNVYNIFGGEINEPGLINQSFEIKMVPGPLNFPSDYYIDENGFVHYPHITTVEEIFADENSLININYSPVSFVGSPFIYGTSVVAQGNINYGNYYFHISLLNIESNNFLFKYNY